MKQTYTCWSCGATHDAVPQIYRTTECPSCEASVKVCKNCKHYDESAPHSCREPVAEPVRDKEQANFCSYFQPSTGGGKRREEVEDARAKLEALFKGLD